MSRILKVLATLFFFFIAFIFTAVLAVIVGRWSLVVPLVCAGLAIYAFIKDARPHLGISSSWAKILFGCAFFVTLLPALAIILVSEENAKNAQRIVDMGKVDLSKQSLLLEAADEGTLDSLNAIAPELELSERTRRKQKEDADKAAQAAINAEKSRQAEAKLQLEQTKIKAEVTAKVKAAKTKLSRLNQDDFDGRIEIYNELVELEPNNLDFDAKLKELKSLKSRHDEILENPEKGLELIKYNWTKEGFGTVMALNATVKNNSEIDLKDFTIECEIYAPSGTKIDKNSEMVLERVKAKTTRYFKDIRMSFIDYQASNASCKIVIAKRY